MTDSAIQKSPRDAADIAACTCANLRKATRVVTQAYDTALAPTGLRTTQFSLLAALSRRPDLPLTQLAEALVMDRTTLTRNLKPLVGQGLIRIDQEKDARVRRINLTEDGKSALNDALPRWQEAQSRLVEALGQGRWSGFLDDLAATVAAAQG